MGNSSLKKQVPDLEPTKPASNEKFMLDKCVLDESDEEIEEIDIPYPNRQQIKKDDGDRGAIDHTFQYSNPNQNKQNLKRQNSENLSLSFAPTCLQSRPFLKKC